MSRVPQGDPAFRLEVCREQSKVVAVCKSVIIEVYGA